MSAKWIAQCATALALAVGVAGLAVGWRHWYRPDLRSGIDKIEESLLTDTPLGSTECAVIAHLRNSGIEHRDPWAGIVQAGVWNNDRAGDAFVHARLGEYGVFFKTSVEAFYIFDAQHRLVEVSVRSSTDAF